MLPHLLAAVMPLLALSVAAAADPPLVLHVDDDAPVGGDGATWATAFRHLQDALHAADDNAAGLTEVRIAQGQYRPDRADQAPVFADDRSMTFRLRNRVTLAGGYAGLSWPAPDQRDMALFETVLTGELGDPTETDDNTAHVVTADGVDQSAVLDGLTIAHGDTTGMYPRRGAGMLVVDGDPIFRDCVIRDNHAQASSSSQPAAGGAAVMSGRPRFERCVFTGNTGFGRGSAVHTESDLVFVGCTFDGNGDQAVYAYAVTLVFLDCVFVDGVGPAVQAESAVTLMIGCTFESNHNGQASGFYTHDGSATVLGCAFLDNEDEPALFADGEATISQCHFEGNLASGSPAFASFGLDPILVHACRFVNNRAYTFNGGGAVESRGYDVRFVSCMFIGNVSDGDAGALWVRNGAEIVNCTFSQNDADGQGNALRISSDAVVRNTIIWDNTAVLLGDQIRIDVGNNPTFDFCCLQGLTDSFDTGGIGNIADDPGFADADLRLVATSPCIDAADPGALEACGLDLDGRLRSYDTNPTSLEYLIVDMGPYEFASLLPADCDGSGFDDACELAAGAALDCNANGIPDRCDVVTTSADCNGNLVPDECELAGLDCDGNGVLDPCDIADGARRDCNGNGIPDGCDIGGGLSLDCNGNGLADECEIDCNANGVPDDCDIAGGVSLDLDRDGVPDECGSIANVTRGTFFSTIADAIAAAVDGETVEVAPGIYAGPVDLDGRRITLRSTGGPANTIIDGGGTGPVITCNSGETAETVLEGFTITGGWTADDGGGMLISDASPTVAQCCFVGNGAEFGGGMRIENEAAPIVTGCVFEENAAISGGGLSVAGDSAPVIIDSVFRLNVATTQSNYDGAGGGVSVTLSDVTLRGCLFEGNQTYPGSFPFGGVSGAGLALFTAVAVVEDCVFRENFTMGNAGGIGVYGGRLGLDRCSFEGNFAFDSGGGLMFDDAEEHRHVVSNCLFTGNAVGAEGGAIKIAWPSDPTVQNCTIVGNAAPLGGGLHHEGTFGTLRSCIVRGNLGGSVTWDTYAPIVSRCNISGGFEGSGNIDADPMFVDAGAGDFRLRSGSPCVDAGDAYLDAVIYPLDLARRPRVQVCRVDMGAYETHGLGPDCDGNGLPDTCDDAPDCNGNGVPDTCDVAAGTSEDCDGDGVPDECQTSTAVDLWSDHVAPFDPDHPVLVVVPHAPAAAGAVTFAVMTSLGSNNSTADVSVFVNDQFVRLLQWSTPGCIGTVADEFMLDPEAFNALLDGGDAVIRFTNGGTSATCPNSFLAVHLTYETAAPPDDADGNGIPDGCERRRQADSAILKP